MEPESISTEAPASNARALRFVTAAGLLLRALVGSVSKMLHALTVPTRLLFALLALMSIGLLAMTALAIIAQLGYGILIPAISGNARTVDGSDHGLPPDFFMFTVIFAAILVVESAVLVIKASAMLISQVSFMSWWARGWKHLLQVETSNEPEYLAGSGSYTAALQPTGNSEAMNRTQRHILSGVRDAAVLSAASEFVVSGVGWVLAACLVVSIIASGTWIPDDQQQESASKADSRDIILQTDSPSIGFEAYGKSFVRIFIMATSVAIFAGTLIVMWVRATYGLLRSLVAWLHADKVAATTLGKRLLIILITGVFSPVLLLTVPWAVLLMRCVLRSNARGISRLQATSRHGVSVVEALSLPDFRDSASTAARLGVGGQAAFQIGFGAGASSWHNFISSIRRFNVYYVMFWFIGGLIYASNFPLAVTGLAIVGCGGTLVACIGPCRRCRRATNKVLHQVESQASDQVRKLNDLVHSRQGSLPSGPKLLLRAAGAGAGVVPAAASSLVAIEMTAPATNEQNNALTLENVDSAAANGTADVAPATAGDIGHSSVQRRPTEPQSIPAAHVQAIVQLRWTASASAAASPASSPSAPWRGGRGAVRVSPATSNNSSYNDIASAAGIAADQHPDGGGSSDADVSVHSGVTPISSGKRALASRAGPGNPSSAVVDINASPARSAASSPAPVTGGGGGSHAASLASTPKSFNIPSAAAVTPALSDRASPVFDGIVQPGHDVYAAVRHIGGHGGGLGASWESSSPSSPRRHPVDDGVHTAHATAGADVNAGIEFEGAAAAMPSKNSDDDWRAQYHRDANGSGPDGHGAEPDAGGGNHHSRPQIDVACAWGACMLSLCIIATGCGFVIKPMLGCAMLLLLLFLVGSWCLQSPPEGCASRICRVILVLVAAVYGVFTSAYQVKMSSEGLFTIDPTWQAYGGAGTAGANDAGLSSKRYDMCSATINGITPLDHCFLAATAYRATIRDAEVSAWFGAANASITPFTTSQLDPTGAAARSGLGFGGFYQPANDTTGVPMRIFVSVRGTATARDVSQDGLMWQEAIMWNLISSLGPFGSWPTSVKQAFIGMVGDTESAFAIEDPMQYATELEGIVTRLQSTYPNASISVSGHSLGGGLATIIGQRSGTSSVSFSGPGILLSARKFNLPTVLNYDLPFTIVPDSDVVPRIDSHVGTVQNIRCLRSHSALSCHAITRTCCELARNCGDAYGRSLTVCRHY